MFNILRIVSYNCHAQNKFDKVFFAEAGLIIQIRRRLRQPKFFLLIFGGDKKFGELATGCGFNRT